MPAADTPAAEVSIDETLVRGLLRTQHPDLADRPLLLVAAGWDNAVFRLGDDLAVRLPRRAMAADLVADELRWLPTIAARLPLPIAEPVRAGGPSLDPAYPFPWSVCRWIDGTTALESPPLEAASAADLLGRFLAALHQPTPTDAPRNPFRGGRLGDRHDRVLQHLGNLVDVVGAVDAAALRRVWDELVALPAWPGPPVWVHGDLHPGNIVVGDDGAIAGVIDFGDLTAGDPATDLSVAWMLLPASERHRVRGDHDDDTWGRARGWALALGVVYLAHSADVPAFAALGHRTLAAVLAQN